MNTQVADPLLGSLVDGRYRVRSRVARGGMATVYTAVDERLERTVALKIIHPGQVPDASFVDRFTDEAKTVARLTHPNVVAVYDQGIHGGLPYLVMEYVRGRTLRDILAERRRLTPAEALAVMDQVLAALGAAHHAGLVHRDVKPENVLVAESPASTSLVDAVVKVADFGLARAVEASADDPDAGQLMATVAYVAPELVAEGYADPRSDVYSAGVMLFEMLTGRVPYDGERPVDVAWQHVDRDVPPPSRFVAALPPALDDLVLTATRRDPDARPGDAAAMLTSVQAAKEILAGGNAATQRMRAVVQPTVVVSQVQERPSWARLPSVQSRQTRPRPRRKRPPTPLEQIQLWHKKITSDPRGRMALAATLAAVLVLTLVGGWWLGFGRYEAAPDLQLMSKDTALATVSAAGLKIEFDGGEFREEVPKDTVLKQEPGPGGRVLKGGTIVVTLSLGPERYLVPNVVGKAKDLATADLQAEPYLFTVEEGPPAFSDIAPVGTVVGTNPPVGQEIKPGGTVQIILSKGRAPITIPSVIGQPVNQATNQLEQLGLKVKVVLVADSVKPQGEVIDQDPAGGGSAERGLEVTLQVSNNPNSVGMPDLTNKPCQEAANQMRGMGHEVDINGNILDQHFGRVVGQSPDPGRPLEPNQKVRINCRQ